MIKVSNLSYSRGSKQLVKNANFQIFPKQRIALVGRNGSGKSSFFAVLRGEIDSDTGEILIPEDWRISIVAQETPSLEISALDYVLDGYEEYRQIESALATAQSAQEISTAHEKAQHIDFYAIPAKAGELLSGLGFAPAEQNKTVAEFSGGWRMRLNLARALLLPADLLLLDEPTNHLDLDALIWLQNYLKNLNCTQIIIAHDRDFLNELCTHVLHLAHESAQLYSGNYQSFEWQYHEQRAQASALFQQEALRKAHLEDFIRRFRAKASKAKQAQSRIKALEKLQAAPPPAEEQNYNFSFPVAEQQPQQLLRLRDISLSFAEKNILQKINLNITNGMRIGLLGKNGAGKSTLLKVIAGKINPDAGEVIPHQYCKSAYFTQHQLDELNPNESALWHAQKTSPQATTQELRNFLGGFAFQGDSVNSPIGNFSGGEKSRLALALLLLQKPNLLLLDEPTNHLDINMRDALTLALQSYQGSILLISHDRSLLRNTCDEFYLLNQGKLQLYEGDLDDYQTLILQKNNDNSPSENNQKITRKLAAEKREILRPLKQKVQKLEEKLQKLQQQSSEINEKLADEALYQDKEALQKLLNQDVQLKKDLQALEEEWFLALEELESKTKELED